MITYARFWEKLEEKKISQYQLINYYHVSRGLLYRMKRNESITTHTIDMLCTILECDISDIMEFELEKKLSERDKENENRGM